MDWKSHGPTVIAAALLVVSLAACGGGGDDSPTAPVRPATVTITYRARTAIDPAVQAQFPNCVNGVRPTHVHPGWRGFAREVLPAFPPDRFEITFTDVPVEAARACASATRTPAPSTRTARVRRMSSPTAFS